MSDWALIGKYLSGNTTAEENRLLEERMITDDKFRSDIENAQTIWDVSAIDIIEIPDPEREWRRFRSRIEGQEFQNKAFYRSGSLIWAAPMAAALLAMAFFLGLMVNQQPDIPPETVASDAGRWSGRVREGRIVRKNEFFEIVTTSDRRSVYLPDSSFVTMSPGSKIQYAPGFGEGHRILSLDGEAFFDVKRDTARTFEILAGNGRTTVLGTSFNLRAYAEEDSVTLLVASGLVDFDAESHFSASLKKDDYMAFYKDSKQYTLRNTTRKKEANKIIKPLATKNSKKTRINIIDSLSLVYTFEIRPKKSVFRPIIYNQSESYSAGNIRLEVTAYDKEDKITGTRMLALTEDIKPNDSLVLKRKIRSGWFPKVDSLSARIIEASETSVYEKRDE